MSAINPHEPFEATLQYLAQDAAHERVKPYYLHFEYDHELPPTNTNPDDRLLPIHNARDLGMPPEQMFSALGFTRLRLACALTPEEYRDPEKVKAVLYPEYRAIARRLFPAAARVKVLEHAIRKRHPGWLSNGLQRHEFETNQPSDYVHIGKVASVLGIQLVACGILNAMGSRYDGVLGGKVQPEAVQYRHEHHFQIR
ncbi:hypothetical protein ARSEF4850_010082, partial [Beauveria asiatica]